MWLEDCGDLWVCPHTFVVRRDSFVVQIVEVYVFDHNKYDSRTGLPRGTTQAEFDARNDAYQAAKRRNNLAQESGPVDQ